MHFRYPRHRPHSAAESSAQGCRSGPSSLRRQVLSFSPSNEVLLRLYHVFPCQSTARVSAPALCRCEKKQRVSRGSLSVPFSLPKKHAPLSLCTHLSPRSLVYVIETLGIKSHNLGLSACACTVRPSPPRQRPPRTEEKERAERAGPSPPLLCRLVRGPGGASRRETHREKLSHRRTLPSEYDVVHKEVS